MKRLLLIFSFVAIVCFGSFARGGERSGKGKEVLEFKMKYLAQELELNGDQQKKFFDLYQQRDAEFRQVFREVKAAEKKVKIDGANASEADYSDLNKVRTDAKSRLAEIEKAYDAKFATFLSKKQIVKMKECEMEFRKKMREYHKKHHKK